MADNTFTHAPREAYTWSDYPKQRYFGKDYLDVGQKRRDTSIQVWRINAADARELARRLIDAAADLEARQAESATQTTAEKVVA